VTRGGRIELRDVTVRYGRHTALEAVSGAFIGGSLTAVVGANGAGKSTLLGVIAGAIRPSGGMASRAPGKRLAYLPQIMRLDAGYPLTVAELIALGGWRDFGAFKAPTAALKDAATEAAKTVGLIGHLRHRIGDLSAGQLKRALFARLILQDASVILLDEPFASGCTHHRCAARANRALAPAGMHGDSRAARPRTGANAFPGHLGPGTAVPRLGPN